MSNRLYDIEERIKTAINLATTLEKMTALTIEMVPETVSKQANISIEYLIAPEGSGRLYNKLPRSMDVMLFRQVVHYVLRERFGLSYPKIARITGGRHTIVMHNVKKMQDYIQLNS